MSGRLFIFSKFMVGPSLGHYSIPDSLSSFLLGESNRWPTAKINQDEIPDSFGSLSRP